MHYINFLCVLMGWGVDGDGVAGCVIDDGDGVGVMDMGWG